jgi:hypothetical protein
MRIVFSMMSVLRNSGRAWLVCLTVCISLSAMGSAQVAADGDDIRGAKALVEIPQPRKAPVALWAGVAGAVFLAASAIFFWQMRGRKQQLASPPEVALKALDELERQDGSLAAEAFADRAAQVLRQYITDRFRLAATRRTTEEFFRDLAEHQDIPLVAESDSLRGFLKSCDLAKFAGVNLDLKDRGKILRSARDLIDATGSNPPSVGKKP